MEVNYSFEELKDFIKNGRKVYYGDSDSFVYYNGMLVKFDPEIYKMIKNRKDTTEAQVIRCFDDGKGILTNPFIDYQQLNYLMDKSSKISLSKLPLGILYFNKIPVGIIHHYFDKHIWLHYLEDIQHKEMYGIASNILYAIRELEENGIYRLGINRNNIVYDGIKPELVDLCGPSISCGSKIGLEQVVYGEYLDFLYSLLYRHSFDTRLAREFRDILTIEDCTYETCEETIKRLEKKI